ncbi:MAG: molecular chaperone HtpG [Bacteroidales bacterium]|jgi:molecular chaperone HtpG|nr:molecular chaperone HtpG [Bacteroidales bacterium]
MTNGKIGVTTENIFPVIKKFLYSDRDIFLRELIANAVDAVQKLKALAGAGSFKDDLGDLTIRVASDEKANTITITDRGIGMTAEEVDKYINQIAFSSAGDFLEKYKDNIGGIIGHFGLGFYSAFMVSGKVEIRSLSFKEGARGVKWTCDGSPEYSMDEISKEDRGTEIILYLDDDAKEYAAKSKIKGLLEKYCKFMPVPISFGKVEEWKDGKYVETDKDEIVNDTEPLWTKAPKDIKDEDYMAFYRKLYPMQEDPLFYIHLNVDYPFHLTGILYFPKIKDRMDVSKNKIQLYCNQMFVTDSVESIVPEFLTLLHGVIDSPDIPLNVSRSYLQSDSNVKKISSYITRKVADRLEEISKKDKDSFESKWDNLKLFIEYGMLTDEKFFDRARKFALLKTTDGKFFGYDDYKKLIEPEQTDKDKKVVYLYTSDPVSQYSYIEGAKNKGYQVLVMDSQLDAHFVNLLEQKLENSKFARVDSAPVDQLIQKGEITRPKLQDHEENDMNYAFRHILPEGAEYNVKIENLGADAAPVLITQSEFMRRYRDMSALGGGLNFTGEMPASYNVELNYENEIIKKVLAEKDNEAGAELSGINKKTSELAAQIKEINEKNKDKKAEEISREDRDKKDEINKEIDECDLKRKDAMNKFADKSVLLKQIADIALLSNGMLKGKALNDFISRSLDLLK